MTSSKVQKLREIFLAACDLSAEQRGEYLVRACDGNDTLRRAVELSTLEGPEASPSGSRPVADWVGLRQPYRIKQLAGSAPSRTAFLSHSLLSQTSRPPRQWPPESLLRAVVEGTRGYTLANPPKIS